MARAMLCSYRKRVVAKRQGNANVQVSAAAPRLWSLGLTR